MSSTYCSRAVHQVLQIESFWQLSVPPGSLCTWRHARGPTGGFSVLSFIDTQLWAAPSTCSAIILHHWNLLKIFGCWSVLHFLPCSGLLQLGSQLRRWWLQLTDVALPSPISPVLCPELGGEGSVMAATNIQSQPLQVSTKYRCGLPGHWLLAADESPGCFV